MLKDPQESDTHQRHGSVLSDKQLESKLPGEDLLRRMYADPSRNDEDITLDEHGQPKKVVIAKPQKNILDQSAQDLGLLE